ncbi:proteasome-activating nucleotidase [Methanococcus voltae]|jgi:proteasome regulatory subunit|uniref:Proteasome-activating nucleotidase n=2 Tax=Methanococcus voltae TaxID=2188 RepID=A0A8J7UTT1_METVO|nr:proteasome-activating nucleotidase [Methanococcus voltae]MBP2172433.1 proteasome regulatory subunit [Methanococcus voltae]MBP2200611.1 proteasome regulatory subunit [Methanococcus voltae]MCS3921336.1 proteasome regulatory subunit [Methanococcus voltae PS]
MNYPEDYSSEINDLDLDEYKERNYIMDLENKILRAELKNKDISRENSQLKKENEILKRELDKLRIPPLIMGTVIDKISSRKVVVKSSTGPNFLVNISQFVDPEEIVPGERVCLNQQTLAVVEVLSKEKDYRAMAMEIEEKPNITFEEIGGLSNQIREIKEVVELPLKKPELFEKIGIVPPKGILLYGPPGTGKTLLAKAVAYETNASFIRVVGSELVKKFIGEGAKLVRDVFKLAKEKSPCIIFIDEIDAVASKRTESLTGGDREVQRTLMQLLAEMDGFDSRGDVKIIAATNRPDILDSAILRPGRFDRIIEIANPDEEGRIEILKIHTSKMNLKNIELKDVAKLTEGMVGADLKAVCTEAGMFAIREDREYIKLKDFEEAIDKIKSKTTPKEEIRPQVSLMYG